MKRPINPIAAQVAPLQGQPLPKDFYRTPLSNNTTYDKRDLSQLWKSPNWQSKITAESVQNTIRGARLTSAPSGI
jgi:hypothetical protein